MRRGTLHLLATLVFGVCLVPSSFANTASSFSAVGTVADSGVIAEDQVLPWPWAMQCPFPWEEIDGNWLVTATQVNGSMEDRFEFEIEYVAVDGTRFFEVKRFDQAGNLRARGRGFSAEAVKLIRVAMIELDATGKSSGSNYWAFVGSYQQDKTASCSADVTTVITVRSLNDNATKPSDVHYVVSKEPMSVEHK